jgi:hypothetical protein
MKSETVQDLGDFRTPYVPFSRCPLRRIKPIVASHDLEDIVAVVDGRPGLGDEVKAAPVQLLA